ncbi:DUF4321 domain-containing protein [Sedimentibacter hydroxybenzoicus DSM 7310]|uniref:DUF4321 domain-containing protein n=1 Tax=Sedimentibacter hydroxybenzoicus DSM 7310 TaxID=1123245 RepID=A0A974GW35_SEDHY|nr:DUF4321 domain-containing protein [Sedimentibacter hydroxybenzoicus]NYB74049.1 DUF4321 domain-containing protein [Sedimentibacter hydroxybenzoicus DSM 7310]
MRKGNSVYLILLLLTSVIIGTILGRAFSEYLPVLNYGESIGFGPATLDLSIFTVTFGFNASLTVAGIIGIIIAIIVYKKL